MQKHSTPCRYLPLSVDPKPPEKWAENFRFALVVIHQLTQFDKCIFVIKKKDCLPAVVSADAPHPDRVDGLRVEDGQVFRVDQLEGALVQIHEQVLALHHIKKSVQILILKLFKCLRLPSVRPRPADRFCPGTNRRCTCWPPCCCARGLNLPRRFPPSRGSALQIGWSAPWPRTQSGLGSCGALINKNH